MKATCGRCVLHNVFFSYNATSVKILYSIKGFFMKKNILVIMLSALCMSSVYQVDAQHGLENIQKRYERFLSHIVVDVIEQIRDEAHIHKLFFLEMHRELLAWRIFWKIRVNDFCKKHESYKLTEELFLAKLSQDKSEFWLSQELIDLGYVDSESKLHPLAQEAFSCIAFTLRKLTVLTSGYFLPPEERKKRGITGKHFDVNLEICMNSFEAAYEILLDTLVNYILEDGFEEKSPDQMINDFSRIFKTGQFNPKIKANPKPKKATLNPKK
jgi:hypothetical protein